MSSAHKVAPQRPANELLSELEHMAPPEPGEGLQDGIGGHTLTILVGALCDALVVLCSPLFVRLQKSWMCSLSQAM